jgi:hypothetical protein
LPNPNAKRTDENGNSQNKSDCPDVESDLWMNYPDQQGAKPSFAGEARGDGRFQVTRVGMTQTLRPKLGKLRTGTSRNIETLRGRENHLKIIDSFKSRSVQSDCTSRRGDRAMAGRSISPSDISPPAPHRCLLFQKMSLHLYPPPIATEDCSTDTEVDTAGTVSVNPNSTRGIDPAVTATAKRESRNISGNFVWHRQCSTPRPEK